MHPIDIHEQEEFKYDSKRKGTGSTSPQPMLIVGSFNPFEKIMKNISLIHIGSFPLCRGKHKRVSNHKLV